MTYIEYIQKLEYINYLIEKKATGSPKILSEKLEVSERTVRRMLKHLKKHNVEIKYCRRAQSYILET
ncbi:MAG: HTH domain-containing protein [Bacteroidales bacterium]|nr:HTH domain-containing protein [Bacteroidales bacterium]